ncbi:twin-arginine translocase TatA/TatE family subunit [Marivirga sp. S37H4]|uniref:Sec-independent protein translocase protein TatA n=1 Tax=Marivirga aurantiaca TaxID=2802615 RepID=A0A934WXW0_9BACT|nr:twin-arginine translocase TatA/TatE family subunit [Marivirga aurantiaca]MBK6265178.1 twin-arginine translocase TatA/TatE family subunit [Marivirga aurantiaca]
MNTVFAFLGGLGGWEILLIMLVILIFFGAKKIPELARGLGKGIREFKDATTEIKDEIQETGKSAKVDHKE